MDRQQEFVLRTIEERDIRFVRLWFPLNSRVPSPRESASTVRSSRASHGSTRRTCWPPLTPRRSRSCRGGGRTPALLGCSATSRYPTARQAWRTHVTYSSARWPRPGTSASASTCIRRSSSSCSRTNRVRASALSRSTTPAISTTCRTARATTSVVRRSPCSSPWASLSSSATTRARRARTRSTSATRTRCRWPTTS